MRVVIANYDDWQGIYVDGELKYENHTIPYFEILHAVGVEFKDLEVDMYKLNWGRLPDTEEELREKLEKINDQG